MFPPGSIVKELPFGPRKVALTVELVRCCFDSSRAFRDALPHA